MEVDVFEIFNIGYERRSLDELCTTLAEAGVSTLVDVRQAAWSYRPEFRKGVMQRTLGERGIEYVHCKPAGNPYRPRKGEPADAAVCAEKYSEYLDQHPEVLDQVARLAQDRPIALFCYERDRSRCHRGVLITHLTRTRYPLQVVDL